MKKLIGLPRHLPVIRTLRILLRLMIWFAALTSLVVAAGFLLFTFQVLPNLDRYRISLQQEASRTLGRPVAIGKLSGTWDGIAPRFELSRLSIADSRGGEPLTFEHVVVVPSWQSLLALEPRMALIELSSPSIDIYRGRDDHFYLNGFPLSASTPRLAGQANPADLLLRQKRIVILGARIAWQDEYLGLPKLTLSGGQLELSSGLLGHDLQLSGTPPASVGTHVDLVGSWHGDRLEDWKKWSGSLRMSIAGAQVSSWNRYLQSFGLMSRGEGKGSVELSFDGGRIDSLQADVAVKNAAYTLPGASELAVPVLSGHLALTREGSVYQVKASHLTLMSEIGPVFQDSTIDGYWDNGGAGGGKLSVDHVNLAPLAPFLNALGMGRNPLFAHFDPSGRLDRLSLEWQGRLDAPSRYRVDSDFTGLSWLPFGQVPGVEGLGGSVKFDQNGGRLTLKSADRFILPAVFSRPLAFSSLAAEVGWQLGPRGIQVGLDKFQFANADMNGQFSGRYARGQSGAGTIDLTGGIEHLSAARVIDYLPYQAGADTIRWLSGALKGGVVDSASLRLAGDLDRFPFKGGQGGLFQVDATVRNATLQFDRAWPALTGFDASLLFHNEGMTIKSASVATLGNRLTQVQVGIADLGAADPRLEISGQSAGELANMLRYTVKSPVDGWLSGFLGQTRATGSAVLHLGLSIPLSAHGQPKVNGQLQLIDNRLEMTSLPLPPLQSVNGLLGFSEHGVSTAGIGLKAFGGAFVLKADCDDSGRSRFAVDGQADSRQVAARYIGVLAPHFTGMSHYQARFAIRTGLESLQLSSDLAGTRFDAPAPFAKAAATALPFNLSVLPERSSGGARLDFSAGSQIAGRVHLDGDGVALSSEVALGRALGEVSQPGLRIRAALPQIDIQSWLDWLNADQQAPAVASVVPQLHIELASPQIVWGPYSLHRATLIVGHEPGGLSWHADVDAAEAQGAVDYDTGANGRVQARLSLLSLDQLPNVTGSSIPASLPEMDIHVARLVYKGSALGSLNLNARYAARDWLLDNVSLNLPEGSLSGSAKVTAGGAVETRFKAQTTDLGRLLARVGVKDSFAKGRGSMTGSLSWRGGLADFEPGIASGRVSADLADGRFAKVDPGVARLLGVLSLQSLPRRIHLDFTDVFSEGFAFDALKGDAVIDRGIFKTDNLSMRGPGADVDIKGEVDLVTETQSLRVHVEPHLSEGVALATGAALINPVAGVAALAAQKVLRDPVSRIFSVDYSVSGKIADPVVTRINKP